MPGFRSAIALIAVTGLAGCATGAQEAGVPGDRIPVHESVTSAPPRYDIVKRLWIESWRSAFFVPSYASAEEAAAHMRRRAEHLGGNGVINFGCYRKSAAADAPLACNGTIVRFR
jgi:hypothetical protein